MAYGGEGLKKGLRNLRTNAILESGKGRASLAE